MLPLAQLTETAIPVIDKAASASDRWLFLAALAIIIIGGAAAIRWLIKSIEVQNAAHALERSKLVDSLAAKDAAHSVERESKDKVHVAERERLVAEIKAEHAECRASRKEDQAAFLAALEKKDVALAANTRAVEAVTQLVTRAHMDKHNAS